MELSSLPWWKEKWLKIGKLQITLRLRETYPSAHPNTHHPSIPPPHSVNFQLIFLPWFPHLHPWSPSPCLPSVHSVTTLSFRFSNSTSAAIIKPTLPLGPFSSPTLPSVFFFPFLLYTCEIGLTVAWTQHIIVTISTEHNKIRTRS